jgi:hypothetical protein
LDYHAFWIAVKALCRRYDITTAQCLLFGDNYFSP